ncbi:type VII secretion protein EccCa [Actinomadura sp. 9N407]|uniref:type VII secretion protein EccCa n=1 Tax=Actinomadura sp. 9N407 TaxID=3375154 RepID=UPI00379F8E35
MAAIPQRPSPPSALQSTMQVALPALGGLGMVMFMIAGGNPIFLLAGIVMITAMVAGGVLMFIGQRTGARRQAASTRELYLSYLEDLREELRKAARAQSEAAAFAHPPPGALLDFSRQNARRWERRPGDADFLHVRIGLGTVERALRATLRPSGNPLEVPDAICHRAAERLVENYTVLHNQPITVPLGIGGTVSVVGSPEETREVARLLIAQTAALHAPDDVRLALCFAREAEPLWRWVKWLPHCLAPATGGPDPRRYLADSADALRTVLERELAERTAYVNRSVRLGAKTPPRERLVVIVDENGLDGRAELRSPEASLTLGDLGVCVVHLVPDRETEPSHVDVRVSIDEVAEVDDLRDDLGDDAADRRPALTARLDEMSGAEAEALARALAPLRLVHGTAGADEPLVADLDLAKLLGAQDIGDLPISWLPRTTRDFLRVPIGVTADGTPLILDLKESAQGGMGPHGVCVGATGAGKSELLRTLVLALAMTHSPERLAFVLVDYKGGATFAGLEGLPHTAGSITNLSDDLGLVDRMHEALFGELKRRQQILMDAGNLSGVAEYNRRRDSGQRLEPLPNLLVIVDEFSELLAAKPDFIQLFIAIGRIGRSIGMHQLLASQRLEEGRLRGLESYVSYRLALRTFNAEESRAVLGAPDAYELPPVPGSGYLKVDTTMFERFKGAYVSGPYRGVEMATDDEEVPLVAFPTYPGNEPLREPSALESEEGEFDDDGDEPTVLGVTVERLAAMGGSVHQVWLPPLPRELTLDAITGQPVHDPRLGLRAHGYGGLRVPLGLLDVPAEQRQNDLCHDFSSAGGHLAILGAPQSGKSTALRTLILAAALTHTPGEVAFHCVDFGGGTLAGLADLPHVGTVCGRLDTERVRRTIGEAAVLLDDRERIFGAKGIDSPETMRRMWQAGELPELEVADVFLVIDNYMTIKSDYEDLGDVLADIAARGLAYGVHLILTAPRWHDLRTNLQPAIGGRIELRLNDPMDSMISRKHVENIRSDQPGRCLTADRNLAQIALPRLDGDARTAGLYDALLDAASQINHTWPGPRVPPVRLLPPRVDFISGRLMLGIGETDLRPVNIDLFGVDEHLLIFGEGRSGKTSLLKCVVRSYIDTHTDGDVVFAVFDPRRSLLGFVPDAYLGAYAGTPDAISGLAVGLSSELKNRLPPEDVTPEQLRDRSWWQGPQIVVVIDDYELLPSGSGNPLAPLMDFLPQARDIGLHFLLARHAGGVGRALFEPFLQRLRELGATGFVMSGDRQEGQLWPGVYPAQQPPGRGALVRRGRRPLLVQTAYLDDRL